NSEGFIVTGGTFTQTTGTLYLTSSRQTDNAAGYDPDLPVDVITVDVPGTIALGNLALNLLDNNVSGADDDPQLAIATGDTLIVTGTFKQIDGVTNGGTISVQGNVVIGLTDAAIQAEGGTTQLQFTGSANQ